MSDTQTSTPAAHPPVVGVDPAGPAASEGEAGAAGPAGTITPLLVQVLELQGRPWRACRYCGRVFEPNRSYNEKRHAPQRLYCSTECRDLCRTRRRAPRRALLRAHVNRYSHLRAMHEQEDAGQLAIGGPLPEVPPVAAAGGR